MPVQLLALRFPCLVWFRGVTKFPQQVDDLLVVDLCEVFIELANCPEALGSVQTNHFIAPTFHFLQALRRSDGDGDDQLMWILRPGSPESGDHGGTGGDAVVRYDHRTPLHRRWRPNFAIEGLAPGDFRKLMPALLRQIRAVKPEHFLGMLIQVYLTLLGYSADRQLGLGRRPQFSRQNHI